MNEYITQYRSAAQLMEPIVPYIFSFIKRGFMNILVGQ